jgi:hypothetical protein
VRRDSRRAAVDDDVTFLTAPRHMLAHPSLGFLDKTTVPAEKIRQLLSDTP